MSRYGEPEDVEGQCNAHLYIGDNFGDNHATMRCQLSPDHEGLHQEKYRTSPPGGEGVVTWEMDEREEEPDESKKCEGCDGTGFSNWNTFDDLGTNDPLIECGKCEGEGYLYDEQAE